MSKRTKELTAKRMERYKAAQETTERVSRVIERVLAGESETSACRAENVNVSWMRRYVQSDLTISRGKETDEGYIRVKLEDWIDWQDKFLRRLAGEECYAPEDFDHIFEECLTAACNETECTVMRMRFPGQMTLRAIGKKLGVTSERIRQIESKALRKLRYPRYRLVLMYGRDYEKQLKDVKTAQAAYDQARLECMNRSREEMLAAVTSAKEKHDALVREAQELSEAAENLYKRDDDLVHNIKVTDLDLSVRAQNALHLHYVIPAKGKGRKEPPIETVGQLSRMSMQDLRMIRNIGAGTANEIARTLYDQYGIMLQ